MSTRRTIEYFSGDGQWTMNINSDNSIEVDFQCAGEDFNTSKPRIYDIPKDIIGIEHDTEYVHLTVVDKRVYQCKFEQDGDFIGDIIGVNGEYEGSFAAYSFWDDL
jgi:hypothetical protein|tara:strand:+ start:30 stop:347 length:318 start_codon:yes stop_codon:yes gene_type:complete